MRFLLIGILLIAWSQEDWVLKKEKSGIQVYTRSVEYSDFDEAKGHIIISETSLQEVVNVIIDIENYETLLYDCINPKFISQESDSSKIFYLQQKAPWPVNWRDGVYRQILNIDREKKTAIIKFNVIEYNWPTQPDVVRLEKGKGLWQVRQINASDVEVIYTLHGEPAGDVPAWVTNMFMLNQPYQTLKNLENRVK
jgi:hypothetical protein